MKSNALHLRQAILCFVFLFGIIGGDWGQTTVTYTIQTGNFNYLNTEKNNNPPYAGTTNNNATEMQQYANGGSFGNTPGAAAFQTFTTTGVGSGTARTLRVGDRFTITVYTASNPSSGGSIGISFRNTTSVTNFFSSTDVNTVARFQLDNTGGWKIYNGGTTAENTGATSGADRTLSIEITSSNTFNATISGTTYYDLSFATAGPIAQFCIYTYGDSNPNSFWKNGSLTNFGHSAGDGLRFGYGLSGSSTSSITGTISDGQNTNSTSGTLANVVFAGGSSGTAVILSGSSTYTGATTINNNGTLRLGAAGSGSNTPLGTTAAGTTVSSGGSLDLNGFNLATTEALTLNGTGQSSNGALRNGSTAATYSGLVTLGSASSIIGGTGTIALSNVGTITGATFGLTLGGAQGGSIASIIGTTSGTLTKQDAGTWTLSGANTYTGATSITGGTLTLSGSGTLGTGSDVSISSGATLNLNGVNATVGSISETGSSNGGVVTLGAGTLTINGANKGTKYQNSISGTGGITMSGSGTTELVLYGAATTYSGATTVTGGKLSTSASLSSTAYTVSGGTFQLNAANVIPNAATLTLSGGTFSTSSSAGFAETLGTLTVSTNNSTINLGTGSHTLTFAASNGVSWTAGKFLLITGWSGSYNSTTGTAGKLYIGSNTSGLTAIQLGQIFFWNGTNYYTAAQLSDGEVVPTTSITYFSKSGQTLPTSTTNWTVSPDGTGSNPANFTTSTHTFVVQNGHTYTLSGADWTVSGSVNVQGTLYVSNSSTARTLSTGNLITSGTVYIDVSTAASTLTVTGDFTQLSGTMDLNAGGINSTTSTFNIGGNFTQSSGATLTESGGNIGLIVFTKASGTQTYSQAGTFSNAVRVTKNAAGTLSLSSDVTWTSNVTISSGTLDFGSTVRTMTLSTGSGSLNFSGGTVLMNGGNVAHKIIVTGTNPIITFPSTWTHGTGDIFEFNQSGSSTNIDQNVTFNHLTITSGTTRVGTTSGGPFTATVGGDLTINGGTLTITEAGASHILTVNGNVTVNSGGTLNTCNSTSFNSTLNLYGNLSVNGTGALNKTSGALTSTINFLKSSGIQTVSLATSASYAHAWVVGNGSTTNTVQVGANWGLGASSSLSIESGSSLDIQTYTITGTSATFNAKSGSTVITQNASGLSTTAATGAVQVTGSKTYNTGANYNFNGTLAQGTGNGITGANNLTVNNSAGVSLSGAVSVSGTLTFTSGLLTTTGSNLLTITNTATSAISGAGTGKYVSGPLKWNLSNSNGTYNFPVGKGGNYYPFSLATTAASSPVITVESFNSDAGGTNGATITSPSTTEYWSATLNSGTFTGSLSLTRPSALTSDVIAQSATQTGTYSSIGGTLSSPSVNNSNSISTLGFFKFATSAACADPTTQATGLSFTSVGATSMTINWSGSGNGDGVIVVMKAGSAPTDPSDNNSYTASTTFGSGTDVGSSSFVVFNGSGSSVSVTNLSASTTYHVRVYSKNCSGASIKINTTSPLSGSQITLATELAAHPASFTASSTIGGQVDLSFSAASTINNAFGYIILQKTGSNPTGAPSDATSYSIGGTIGDGTVADIITDVSQTSTTISGLNSSTAYYYSILPLSYDGTNAGTYNYYTAATIPTANATTPAAVTRYAIVSGNWNATSTWSSSSGGASGASVPTGSDVVYLDGTYSITVTAAAACGQLNFSGTGSTVSIDSGITLAVSGAVRANQSATQHNSGTISGLGTLTCTSVSVGSGTPMMTANRTTTLTSTISTLTSSGTLTLTSRDVGAKNDPYFYLQSGTFTCTDITTVHPVGSNVAIVSLATGAQSGTLNISGATPFTLDTDGTNTITLNGTGATVEYSGTAQTVLNTSYTNLTLSGSGNKTFGALTSISGKLSIQGTAVAITTAPTFGASSTLEYKNVGNRTTNAIEWPSASGPSNLIIDNSGSTVTMLASANRTLSGNLTLTAGTLADAGNTLTLQGNIAGTATHSGAGVISMTGASKTISGATLGNVTLNNASGFSLNGSPTINGALTFTSGKLSLGANTLNLAGTVASMTTTNSITGSTSSNISITGTGTLGTLIFDQTTAGTTNALSALNINRSSTGIVNLGSALNLAANLTVTNGSLRSSGANTLTMAGTTQSITISTTSGGSILGTDNSSGNDLTLAIASGSTTTLTGDASSSSDDDKKFFNITVNSGGTLALSRGILCKYGTFTVNGTLQINSNGYLQATPTAGTAIKPTYGASSLLKYNVGAVYGRGIEWSATSGAGYPNDVQVSNNTTLDVPNTGGAFSTNLSIARDLTIDAGSSMYMDYGAGDASGSLTVGRDISIAGAFSLGDAVGGDLNVGRNWTHTTGTFNANSRAVSFNGATGDQTITNASGETFPYLTINKATSGGVTLSGAVTVSNTLTLTKGVVTTTSSNLLQITNTSAAAMSGGSSTSYINGPFRWSVSNSGGGDYKFHVGKSATYLPFNINNPVGSSPVLTVEAFATSVDASPTYGNSLSSVSSSEYWLASNTGTLTSGTISLAKGTIGSLNAVASSTTAAGSYSSLGGSAASTLITSNTVTAANTSGSMATPTYFVLATKVPAPTISSFTPSTVYVGTTITITGTDFTNTSAVSIGGVAASSFSVISATSISAVVAASASSGTISVTTPGGTATSSSSFTFSGYVSAAASDWNSTSTWLGGALPPASSAVTIDHAVTVNGTVANNPSSVTINSAKSLTFGASGALTATTVTNNGSLIMTAGGTLTIASGGTLANGSSTFTYGAGTVAFAGSGTVTGTIGFNNVTIAGAVNFGTTATMNGILTINAGGAINTNAPSYASGSTLKYNSGNTYGRYLEWNATSGVGYPYHVQVSNNTTLNVTNASNVARQIAGNLTVDAGSTLSMEGMTIASPTVIGLTIGGNILNYGTITVSTSTERVKCVDFTNNPNATTTLSSAIGGDLEVTGSFVDNGTYNANTRAIFFTGTGTQNISGTGTFDIDYMVMNKASGEVVMLNDLKCEGPNGGNAITLTSNTDVLNLNGFDIVFGKSGVSSIATGSGKLKGHVNSDITILGTGSFGTLNFDNSFNTIGSLTLNRTSSGSFGLGSNLIVSSTLTLTDGALSIGAYSLECQNVVNVTSGTIKGSSSSTLILSGGNTTAELKMDNTTPGTTNLLSALTLSKTGASSAVNITANVIVNGALSISGNGTNTLSSSKQLTVNGTLTNNGILTLNSGSTLVQGTSSMIAGSGTYNVKQDVTGSGGSSPNGRFWYLGSPLSNGLSTALLSSTGNLLWQWNESSFAYVPVTSGQTLTQGKSYVLRSGQTSETINFSGTGLSNGISNGTVTVSGLTRSGTSQQFRGCHLVSNPFPSYLDWNAVCNATGTSNIGTTMYVRTASNSSIDVLETYNSYNGQGTSISGPAMTKYIAPMQGFWVKVTTDGLTGSLTMNNSMRSHQSSGSGLRSSAIDFPAYLRFNMIDGQNKDQVILLMSPDASMSLDNFDSEKMSASGYAQFYSTVNATKLVINGMKNVKAKTSVPLTLVMPTSKSYTFQAEEFNIEDGLILLEDKQEGVIQDLTINPTYSFFGNAGTNATRFVVHFQLATAPVLVGGPQELESLGSEDLTTDNIQIVSNNQGTVIVRLDEGFKPEGSIRIFDASGRLVEQTDFNDQETTIHLNEQAGMYFVEVSAGKLMVKKKIVIN